MNVILYLTGFPQKVSPVSHFYSKRMSDVYSFIGRHYFEAKRYDKALNYYKYALINNPNRDDRWMIYSLMAHAYYCNDAFNKSLKYYELSIEYLPFGSQYRSIIHSNIASIYTKYKNYDIAIKHYELAIESTTSDFGRSDYYFKISNVYANGKKDYQYAITCYKMAETISKENVLPNLGSIYAGLANAYNGLNDDMNSLVFYKMAMDNGYTGAYHPLLSMSDIFLKRSEWDNLIENCNELIKLQYKNEDGNSACPFALMAHAYYKKNDTEKALEYCKMAIEKNYSKIESMYSMMGFCYSKKRDYVNSIIYYKKALKSGFNDISVMNIAIVYINAGIKEKALKYIRRNLEFYEEGKIDMLYAGFEHHIKTSKDHNLLIRFYIGCKTSTSLLEILNTDSTDIQPDVLVKVINYFGELANNNLLHHFLSSIINPKTKLLELHFNYAIKSGGYEQAKTDFLSRKFKDE